MLPSEFTVGYAIITTWDHLTQVDVTVRQHVTYMGALASLLWKFPGASFMTTDAVHLGDVGLWV